LTLTLRRAQPADIETLAAICYGAFKAIAEEHNFPPDLPSVEAAVGALTGMIADPRIFDLVAEVDGRIVGSNFLDERDAISGIGPITIDPAGQNGGAGHALMEAAIRRSDERGFAGVRLVQAAYHRRSLALYLKLGFEARELLACLQGPAIGRALPGLRVRPATAEDMAACNALCFSVHGHDRAVELSDAVTRGTSRVVERGGRISGYATMVGFFGHAVGESDDDLFALIAEASAFAGPGFLVPTRNGALMRRCLGEGLRIVQTMTLMSRGLYNTPQGAWLPSVLF
jgi:predicted N-acetyltransferase YhbS